jgi:hypothetical protein
MPESTNLFQICSQGSDVCAQGIHSIQDRNNLIIGSGHWPNRVTITMKWVWRLEEYTNHALLVDILKRSMRVDFWFEFISMRWIFSKRGRAREFRTLEFVILGCSVARWTIHQAEESEFGRINISDQVTEMRAENSTRKSAGKGRVLLGYLRSRRRYRARTFVEPVDVV